MTQQTRSKLTIEPTDLARQLGTVVVLDCRFSLADPAAGLRDYSTARIPGAIHLDMDRDLAGAKNATSGRHPLPDREAFEAVLHRAGVDGDSNVVVYDDNRLAGAARAWWLGRWFGLTRTRVLDGGFAAWRAAGAPLETGPPQASRPGSVRLGVGEHSAIAATDQVLDASKSGSPPIVDSREPPRYAGVEEPIDPVAGRIPGALNLPWTTVTDESGRVREESWQRERWSRMLETGPPIVYCGSGVTACVNLLSRELAGLPPGRLYPGSWSQWCADPSNPVDRDEA